MSTNVGPSSVPESAATAATERKWQPLNSTQRRVLGVLVEKAKTTPEQYPLSLNGLTTGCNQKSNRDPLMNLEPDQVEQALDELRHLGASVEIQSGGRVAKYKHCLYEWLGVDKVELAVLAELLLRGEQTVGELRGRAARMEPIADLNALRPVLRSLMDKGLVVELTPEGRGQIVAHALYRPADLEELRARYRGAAGPRSAAVDVPSPRSEALPAGLSELRAEVAELRAELEKIRDQFQELRQTLLG